MARLSTKQRKSLPKNDFAVPSKAPKSGSYPINNASHARNALARSSGKPVAAQVKKAVGRKYPGMISKSQAARVATYMKGKK
jgi:hypothetical protein